MVAGRPPNSRWRQSEKFRAALVNLLLGNTPLVALSLPEDELPPHRLSKCSLEGAYSALFAVLYGLRNGGWSGNFCHTTRR